MIITLLHDLIKVMTSHVNTRVFGIIVHNKQSGFVVTINYNIVSCRLNSDYI